VSAVAAAKVPSGEAQDGAAEAIHVENLHKKFGQLHVLKGVSLSARDGEVIAIIGGSGSGKSTLLRCINCLENPTSGIIRVNGEEIKLKADSHGHTVPADRRQIERIRAKLGMVFQNFNLWSHMTLIENVI
jgi:octopine/nopaline transport system ATP-binding protein